MYELCEYLNARFTVRFVINKSNNICINKEKHQESFDANDFLH